MTTLQGHTALVTGATRGLGLAIAKASANEGASVMLHGIEAEGEAAGALAEARSRAASAVAYVQADLRDPVAIERLIAETAATLGAPDIIINNAVVRHFAAIEEFPAGRWDEALAVNLSAPFHLTRLALPAMRKRGWGRIINMSSGYGFFAEPNRVDYITTKTAILGLTRSVAIETARAGITCNAICPGSVLTPAIQARVNALRDKEGLTDEQAEAKYLEQRQPSRRFVKAEDVARMIIFLCGPAGRDVSGAAIPIDGAWLAS